MEKIPLFFTFFSLNPSYSDRYNQNAIIPPYSSVSIVFWDLFRLCPPPSTSSASQLERVPLHSKSLCENMARASGGGGKYYVPTKLGCWGGGGGGHKRRRSGF